MSDSSLQRDVEQLRAEVARLQVAIKQIHPHLFPDGTPDSANRSSPTVIGDNAEPPEAGYVGTWSLDSDGTPVDIWVSVGDAYYDASAQILYGYKYRLRFDSNGKPYAIDSPTRYTIDVPDGCA